MLQAGDGAEALEQLRGDSTITALLLDLEMPIMGGLEASRAVRELEAAEQRARMPIVAVTGEEDSLALSRCREAGMDDWLSKPINIDELVALIGRLLDCQQA